MWLLARAETAGRPNGRPGSLFVGEPLEGLVDGFLASGNSSGRSKKPVRKKTNSSEGRRVVSSKKGRLAGPVELEEDRERPIKCTCGKLGESGEKGGPLLGLQEPL